LSGAKCGLAVGPLASALGAWHRQHPVTLGEGLMKAIQTSAGFFGKT
jgi:hypothetical protein